jgi:hypothetical protein
MLGEGSLERMVSAQSFDRRDFRIDSLGDRNEAGAYRLAVEEHGARAAFSFATSFLRPWQVTLHAKHIEETSHRRRVDIHVAPVHTETHATSAMRSGVAGI